MSIHQPPRGYIEERAELNLAFYQRIMDGEHPDLPSGLALLDLSALACLRSLAPEDQYALVHDLLTCSPAVRFVDAPAGTPVSWPASPEWPVQRVIWQGHLLGHTQLGHREWTDAAERFAMATRVVASLLTDEAAAPVVLETLRALSAARPAPLRHFRGARRTQERLVFAIRDHLSGTPSSGYTMHTVVMRPGWVACANFCYDFRGGVTPGGFDLVVALPGETLHWDPEDQLGLRDVGGTAGELMAKLHEQQARFTELTWRHLEARRETRDWDPEVAKRFLWRYAPAPDTALGRPWRPMASRLSAASRAEAAKFYPDAQPGA